jgi:hypothetical protein
MADLIEKFFRSELTEAEDEALAKRLASSEDAAEQFADSAEKAYFSFGLPEPQAPGRLARFLRSYWGRLLPVVVTLGGLATWYWWPKMESGPVPKVLTAPKMESSPRGEEVPKPQTPVRVQEKVKGLEAPPNPDFKTDYRDLKVVVDQENEGPVTVRILDPSGIEVRRLYEGPLQAGKWAFKWDGILDSGLPAPPGGYQIEVQSGMVSKSREIEIK